MARQRPQRIPWTEQELFQYLRTGYSPMHGVAAGPMGPVVAGLAQLPEGDVRAMAHYLSSLNPVSAEQEQEHASRRPALKQPAGPKERLCSCPGKACSMGPALGAMPAFKNSMNDQQMEDLLVYMRKRFAPDKPAWTDLKRKIVNIRKQAGHL